LILSVSQFAIGLDYGLDSVDPAIAKISDYKNVKSSGATISPDTLMILYPEEELLAAIYGEYLLVCGKLVEDSNGNHTVDSNDTPLSDKIINIYWNDNPVAINSTTTNESGVFISNLFIVESGFGPYNLSVAFRGDAFYNPIQKTVKVVVKHKPVLNVSIDREVVASGQINIQNAELKVDTTNNLTLGKMNVSVGLTDVPETWKLTEAVNGSFSTTVDIPSNVSLQDHTLYINILNSSHYVSSNYTYIIRVWTNTGDPFKYRGLERHITNGTVSRLYGQYPGICKNKIVWIDARNSSQEIHLYDVFTNAERIISTSNEKILDLHIYGDYIVWKETLDFENHTIYLYNISNNTKMALLSAPIQSVSSIAIYGNIVVWSEDDWGDNGVVSYIYNITNRTKWRLTEDLATDFSIYEDKIIWVGINYTMRSRNVYIYNMTTNRKEMVTNDSINKYEPKIHGDEITWMVFENNIWHVYIYNMTTKTSRILTNSTYNQTYPEIYGNTLVWADYRSGDNEIYMCDLATNKELRITNNSAYQGFPKIYGSRIIWLDNRSGKWDVYMYDMNKAPTINNIGPLTNNTITIKEGEKQDFYMKAEDVDNDLLWITWQEDNRIESSSAIGTINTIRTYNANYSSAGSHTIKVEISDGIYSISKTWSLNIVNTPCSITDVVYSPISNTTSIREGESQKYNISGNSELPITYRWYIDNVSLSLNSSDYSYNADHTSAGTHKIKVIISNGESALTSEWTLVVTNVDRPPQILAFDPLINPRINEGEKQKFVISVYDPDEDKINVTWYLDGVVVSSSNAYIFSTNYTSAGIHVVAVIISSGGFSATHEWSANVNDVPEPAKKLTPQKGFFIPGFELYIILIGALVIMIRRKM
jgi:beta propeller repeat protein